MTQTVTTMPVSERRFVADLISNGIHPINIRAKAIRDETLVSAIQQGARTRQIHVLLDENSPEIQALVRSKNLKIRLTLEDQRGKLGGNKLQGSFVMETSNGYYLTWNGPFVLTESAFGPVTRFHGESGEGPGETGSRDVRMFEHDFSSAVEIVLPKQEDDLMHERQIRYSRIVLICAVLVLLAVFVVLGNRVRIWMQQPR